MRKLAVLGGIAAGIALGICFSSNGAEEMHAEAWEGGGNAGAEVLEDGGNAGTDALDEFARIWEKAKASEAAITGEDPFRIPDSRFQAGDRSENDLRVISIAGQCMAGDGAEQVFYVIGRNYVPEGSILPVLFGRRLEYSCTPEETVFWQGDMYYAVRFAVREIPEEASGNPGGEAPGAGEALWSDGNIPPLHHWNIGDTVTRTLDGVAFRFRCIDPNYGEGSTQQGQRLALFLCESVIPANTGSEYVYERREDGSRGYVFHPGPVVNFGESSEYADSKIRGWLAAQETDADIFPAAGIGVESSCVGRTAPGSFSRFERSDLKFYRLGSQLLTGRYFILSVEEAMKYREYLWNVDGCGEEETAANAGTFSGGYWLRTPMGDGGEDTGCVYVVDLVNGNIHPQAVRPSADGETDEELAVTGPIGVRPAFVLRQRD